MGAHAHDLDDLDASPESASSSSHSPSSSAASLGQARLRAEALAAARRFKNTWVEFGAVLIQVRDRAAWRDWGFESFEAYCAKELHIRQKTALKLTASYGFLMRHEPAIAGVPQRLLREDADGDELDRVDEQSDRMPCATASRFPTFEAISVLAGAESRGQFGQEDYAALRERLWGDEASSPKLTRELTERFAEPKPAQTIDLALRKFAMSARRLAQALRENERIPEQTRARAELLAQELNDISEQVDSAEH
ncbi:MAG: hypothetical protein LBM75_05900 [Myxococcales bacterium]|jgi:hypothetical protein|nr:hypothetical protein [Myxococcales bacterium]